MQKFFVLIGFPMSAMQAWMDSTTEAERKEQTDKLMQEWNEWTAAHESSIVDKGTPLGKTKRVMADGITDVKNDFNWHMIIEAESHEAAAEMLKDHPNLKTIPGSFMEVMTTNMPAGM
jgi:hypothetical protein